MGGANEEDGGQGTLREEWHWSSLSIQSPLPTAGAKTGSRLFREAFVPLPPTEPPSPRCLQLSAPTALETQVMAKSGTSRAVSQVPLLWPSHSLSCVTALCTVVPSPAGTQEAGTLEEAAPFHQILVLSPQKDEEAPST